MELMKKAMVLGICIWVLATGCQNVGPGSEQKAAKSVQETQQSEKDNKEQKVYLEKEISLSEKDKIRDVSDIHREGSLLEVSETGISVSAVLLNQAHEGKMLGTIQQKLCYDEKTKKLKIKETTFVKK